MRAQEHLTNFVSRWDQSNDLLMLSLASIRGWVKARRVKITFYFEGFSRKFSILGSTYALSIAEFHRKMEIFSNRRTLMIFSMYIDFEKLTILWKFPLLFCIWRMIKFFGFNNILKKDWNIERLIFEWKLGTEL